MEYEKINVGLYGGKSVFGGKETSLQADTLYCSCKDRCSLYKDGSCLNCRSFLGDRCEKGNCETVKGYTSRARRYSEFHNKYKNDEMYGKLNYPSEIFGVIGDTYWFALKYVRVRLGNDRDYKGHINEWGYVIEDVGFSNGYLHLPIEKADVDFLNKIFSYKPRPLCSNTVISEYADKVVPNIVNAMKRVAPELYKELIAKYPVYDVAPDYVGRYAYTKTLKDGTVITDCHGNVGVKRGDKIYCEAFTKGFVPFNGSSAVVEVTIGDKDKCKITSNDMCDENTRFA